MKKVLIAHQSTIPHYRVPFYNSLEKLKPKGWDFDVVFDWSELEDKRFFKEIVDPKTFTFSTLDTKTRMVRLNNKSIYYQTFLKAASKYHLIIVENAVNNLTYPLCHLYKLLGKQIAYWGHGKHFTQNRSYPKRLSEFIKLQLTRNADGFFAYSPGVSEYLVRKGIPRHKIFVLNNTLDIKQQRKVYTEWNPNRETIRKDLHLQGKNVLIFVGRFKEDKKISLLLDAFTQIQVRQSNFHLLLVGSGGESYLGQQQKQITYFGPITDLEKLAPLYIASDVFVLPGAVGLGPLQALCYDLPIITINSSLHKPEFEYLNSENALILPSTADANEFANAIIRLFSNKEELKQFRTKTWPSISHLTIEQMVQNFIHGVNTILENE
jgi:glycosyltransferase involved in cell wall biosynthesis